MIESKVRGAAQFQGRRFLFKGHLIIRETYESIRYSHCQQFSL